MTHSYTKTLIVSSVLCCATLGSGASAVAQSIQPVADAAQTSCTIDTQSGAAHSAPVPGTLSLNWEDTPLFIKCRFPGKPPVGKVLPRPANGWVPVSLAIDGIAVAFLDAPQGYPLRRPSSVTLSLYPAVVENYEAKDIWYQTRRSQVKEHVDARLRELSHDFNQCKFVASCNDREEELAAIKKASLKDLDRVRDLIQIRNGALILRTSQRTICLSQVSEIMWRAGDCSPDVLSDPAVKPKVEMTRITVDGRTECLFRVNSNTWESRPCPN